MSKGLRRLGGQWLVLRWRALLASMMAKKELPTQMAVRQALGPKQHLGKVYMLAEAHSREQ